MNIFSKFAQAELFLSQFLVNVNVVSELKSTQFHITIYTFGEWLMIWIQNSNTLELE